MRLLLAILVCSAAVGAPARPQMPGLFHKAAKLHRERGLELGLKYEQKESAVVPEWARSEPEPIYRFVQFTDIHYHSRLRPTLVAALAFVRSEVRPAFVLTTGDMAGQSRQQALKRALDRGLAGIPHHAVRGDNWPHGFTTTFGPANWSFTCAGVGFVGASLDRDIVGLGIGLFEPDTWQWLKAALDAHRGRPVVLCLHENLMPASFLDAMRLLQEVQSRANVVAVVTGHLHHEYALKVGAQTHIVGPGFGPHPEHPFKVYDVHADHITARTVKLRDGRFQFVSIYQRIDFPKVMTLAAPRGSAKVTAYSAPPSREVIEDPALAERVLELVPPALVFIQLTGRANEIWADLGDLTGELMGAMSQQGQQGAKK